MELDSSIIAFARGPRPAIIPEMDLPFKLAEILEVDRKSFFHVGFCDDATRTQYNRMVARMERKVEKSECLPHYLLSYPGLDCIIQHKGRRGGAYVRGRIMYALTGNPGNPQSDLVKCELFDDCLEVEVSRDCIFPSTMAISNYPSFATQCKLVDMEMFQNSPVLQELYQILMTGELAPKEPAFPPGRFLAQLLGKTSHPMEEQVPFVRIFATTTDSRWDPRWDLTDLLQQHLPTFKVPEYPQLDECPTVKITQYDGKGNVWFQRINVVDEYQLMDLIEKRLALYHDGNLASPGRQYLPQSSWKRLFCEDQRRDIVGGGIMLEIYKDLVDGKCYRVLRLEGFLDGNGDLRWYVYKVDFGIVTIVYDLDATSGQPLLVPAWEVDPNLCYLPPQCLPARFVGSGCSSDNLGRVDLGKFRRYLDQDGNAKVQMLSFDADAYLGLDAVDFSDRTVFLNRIIPADLVDWGFNFLPVPCRPFILADLHGPMPPPLLNFDRQRFMEEKRNQPVTLFLEELITLLENNEGRLLGFGVWGPAVGGLVPPQVDLWVGVRGREEEGVRSLFQLYHTNENCSVHGTSMQ